MRKHVLTVVSGGLVLVLGPWMTGLGHCASKVIWGQHGGRAYRVGTNGRVKIYELSGKLKKVQVGQTAGKHTPEGTVFQDGDRLIRVGAGKSEIVEPGRTKGEFVVAATDAALTHEEAEKKPRMIWTNGMPTLNPTWPFHDANHFASVILEAYGNKVDAGTKGGQSRVVAKRMLKTLFEQAQAGKYDEDGMYGLAAQIMTVASGKQRGNPPRKSQSFGRLVEKSDEQAGAMKGGEPAETHQSSDRDGENLVRELNDGKGTLISKEDPPMTRLYMTKRTRSSERAAESEKAGLAETAGFKRAGAH